jgi:hypothetical protein
MKIVSKMPTQGLDPRTIDEIGTAGIEPIAKPFYIRRKMEPLTRAEKWMLNKLVFQEFEAQAKKGFEEAKEFKMPLNAEFWAGNTHYRTEKGPYTYFWEIGIIHKDKNYEKEVVLEIPYDDLSLWALDTEVTKAFNNYEQDKQKRIEEYKKENP